MLQLAWLITLFSSFILLKTITFVVYVYNIVITSDDEVGIQHLKNHLYRQFQTKIWTLSNIYWELRLPSPISVLPLLKISIHWTKTRPICSSVLWMLPMTLMLTFFQVKEPLKDLRRYRLLVGITFVVSAVG